MKKQAIRYGAFLTALIAVLSMTFFIGLWTGRGAPASPPGKSGSGPESAAPAQELLFPDPVTLSVVISSHPSWPYHPGQKLWAYMEEATGAKLHIRAFSSEGFPERIKLLLAAAQDLPDLLCVPYNSVVTENLKFGVFEAVDDHWDLMPNYIRFFDSLPEAERKRYFVQRTAGDGKIYCPPIYGLETTSNVMGWMMRSDVFQKHGLAAPQTLDDVYTVCKRLKAIYPDSYPFCIRSGLTPVNTICPAFKNDFSYGLYYDYVLEKWSFGASEQLFQEVIKFFSAMYREQLIPPNFLNISMPEWEQFVSNDQGFLMPEYLVRLDYFNIPNRQRNQNYTWAVIPAPKAKLATGQARVSRQNVNGGGYVVCNTGNPERVKNAFRLLDWMYSDAACELLSWGKPGETYIVTGSVERQRIDPGDAAQRLTYGFASDGLCQRLDARAVESLYSEEQQEAFRLASAYLETNENPTLWLSFNTQEQPLQSHLVNQVYQTADSWISQLILGKRSLSEWDVFQKELHDAGLQELLALYEQAYTRVISLNS